MPTCSSSPKSHGQPWGLGGAVLGGGSGAGRRFPSSFRSCAAEEGKQMLFSSQRL